MAQRGQQSNTEGTGAFEEKQIRSKTKPKLKKQQSKKQGLRQPRSTKVKKLRKPRKSH